MMKNKKSNIHSDVSWCLWNIIWEMAAGLAVFLLHYLNISKSVQIVEVYEICDGQRTKTNE
jgi:hypothetical protein